MFLNLQIIIMVNMLPLYTKILEFYVVFNKKYVLGVRCCDRRTMKMFVVGAHKLVIATVILIYFTVISVGKVSLIAMSS